MLNHKRLFRLARSAWKILILHSVQAKTKYRLKIARPLVVRVDERSESIHYPVALPQGTIF